MADALISPTVGGVMWGLSATAIVYSARKVNQTLDSFKVPLMGVMGAFIFASQMINFSIPGTGSSGHICGALLLSVVLGPYAAVLVIASVLVVQALLFADGGLLALGCNIFNMGIVACFIAYPLIYRTIVGRHFTTSRVWIGSLAASVIALQLGAFAVVLETCFSGISELPFTEFILLMLPIHLAIGLIEGAITASVLIIIKNARPEIFTEFESGTPKQRFSLKGLVIAILAVALLVGGIVSWFASKNPDGLEWAIASVTDGKTLALSTDPVHSAATKLQRSSAMLPDYEFKSAESAQTGTSHKWGAITPGTTVAGLIGSLITLLLAVVLGMLFKHRYKGRITVAVKNR